MIPIYIFYSMFGFQRTGDAFWAAADQMTRGFVLGATAGRTTLNGEGLQHEDGHSLLLASTNPAAVSYDPAFSFEVGHITQDALRRMYGDKPENIFYYLTLYNEPYLQPVEPENVDVEGILAGIHRYSPAAEGDGPKAQLLASGVAVQWALEAQRLLQVDWNVQADVWSVTSWNELAREAVNVDEWNLLHPGDSPRTPYLTRKVADVVGPIVAVTDYMRAVPDQIAQWVPTDWSSVGTDGFGFADTRPAARRYFHVDAESVVVASLRALAARGEVKPENVQEAFERYRIDDPTAVADVKQEGGEAG
jgi:pyruvate dehydrogenase E1 component